MLLNNYTLILCYFASRLCGRAKRGEDCGLEVPDSQCFSSANMSVSRASSTAICSWKQAFLCVYCSYCTAPLLPWLDGGRLESCVLGTGGRATERVRKGCASCGRPSWPTFRTRCFALPCCTSSCFDVHLVLFPLCSVMLHCVLRPASLCFFLACCSLLRRLGKRKHQHRCRRIYLTY